jgi:hypothetical protein
MRAQTPTVLKHNVFLFVLACCWASTSRRFEAPHDNSKRREPPAHRHFIPSKPCIQQYRCEHLQSSLYVTISSPHCTPLNTLIPNFRPITRFFSHCDKHFSNHSLAICVNYAGTRVSQCPSVPVSIIACLAFPRIVSKVVTHRCPPPIS